jgi:trigger factor
MRLRAVRWLRGSSAYSPFLVTATLNKQVFAVSTATDCKRSLEFEIPVEQVEKTQDRVTESLKGRVRLPGFRPGKAPVSLIRSRFQSEIRSEVIESLVPQVFRERVQKEDIKVIGTPDITDLHFEPGEPIRFKAEFEVAPEIELGTYRGLSVKYAEPTVTDEEVDKRLESMRETKAEFVNVDPRPIENGDFVVAHLKSVEGLAEAVDQDNLQIEVGGADTLPAFSENLLGLQPEESKEFEITYPEDYGSEALAGKTVKFQLTPKTIRRKELPNLDDEFARDLGGDFQTLDDLKDSVRKAIFSEKQFSAQREAKEGLIDKLVETHEFPVPEAYVDYQVENQTRARLREMTGQDVDLAKLNLNWAEIKEKQRDKAVRNVKAALLLDKIADTEAIQATQEEIDHEIQHIARHERESVPAVRARLEKEGSLSRVADNLRTEKTLNFLFEQATKEA